jgi:hypothetical protein
MISLPASRLSNKLNKIELENVQAMAIYSKHKSYLIQANKYKQDLIKIRSCLKLGNLDFKNRSAALNLEIIFKADAIENWNLAQVELEKYNNFEFKRKYKG